MSRHEIIELSVARDLADDRPLGKSGLFLTGSYGQMDVAYFTTPEAAELAASLAPNRRPSCKLWVTGLSRKEPA